MIITNEVKGMTSEQFAYWLKGFFELMSVGPKTPEKLVLTAEQVEMIEKHLRSVFSERIMSQPNIIFIDSNPLQDLPVYDPFPPLTTGTPFPPPPYTVTCNSGSSIRDDGFIC